MRLKKKNCSVSFLDLLLQICISRQWYPKLNNIKSFHSEDTILKDGFLYCHEVWLFLLAGGKKAQLRHFQCAPQFIPITTLTTNCPSSYDVILDTEKLVIFFRVVFEMIGFLSGLSIQTSCRGEGEVKKCFSGVR